MLILLSIFISTWIFAGHTMAFIWWGATRPPGPEPPRSTKEVDLRCLRPHPCERYGYSALLQPRSLFNPYLIDGSTRGCIYLNHSRLWVWDKWCREPATGLSTHTQRGLGWTAFLCRLPGPHAQALCTVRMRACVQDGCFSRLGPGEMLLPTRNCIVTVFIVKIE